MFDKELYKSTFSVLRASEDTLSEVMKMTTHKKRITSKTVLFAATIAILTIAFVGTAVAINIFRLQNQVVPDTEIIWTFEGPDGTVEERTNHLMAIQGFLGSTEHAAEIEWLEFLHQFFPHGYAVFDDFDLEWVAQLPEQYSKYWIFNDEMLDTFIEIMERHGLSTVGHLINHSTADEFLASIADGQLFIDDSLSANGSQYTCGTFWIEGSYGEYGFSVISSRKGVFNYIPGGLIGNVDDYDTWEYTNKHGTQLILMQSSGTSMIFLDTETAFITANINAGTDGNPLDSYTNITPFSRSDLEHFADMIDFSQLK